MDLNVITPTVAVGSLDKSGNTVTDTFRVDASETGTVEPSNALVVANTDGGIINMVKATATTDRVAGFMTFGTHRNQLVAGDVAEFAPVGDGGIMRMTAGAAIVAGAKVEYNPTTGKVVTATTGTVIGTAYDKASADGNVIRVKFAIATDSN